MQQNQRKLLYFTGVEGNSSIHDEDGTIGHGLTMDIEKSLSIVRARVMLVLLTLTKRPKRALNKKKKKVHL